VGKFPTWSERVAREWEQLPQKGIRCNASGGRDQSKLVTMIPLENFKNAKKNPTLGKWKQNSLASNKEDQAMGEPKASLAHPSVETPNVALFGDKGWEEGANGSNTLNTKLIFDLLGGHDGTSQRKWVYVNPFETLNGEDDAFDFLKKVSEVPEGGWIFQGKKKHIVKIDLARPKAGQQPQLVALPSKTLGKREVRNIRNTLTPFLTH
jgi:hypothetical protein